MKGARLPARRLRWGVDFHTFDGIYQGSRSHLLGLYREVIRQAPEVDFFFFLSRPESLRAAYSEFASRNAHLIHLAHRPGLWRLGWQLPALQRRYGLDLLHVQYRLPLFPAGACLCTLHDVLFESHPQFFPSGFVRVARWSARRAVRQAAVICTVSEWSRGEIARLYGIAPQQVTLTPNAVDCERFYPGTDGRGLLARWDLAPNGYICSLGRLEPRKNHGSLVRAYAELPRDAPPLVIVGQRDFAYQSVFDLIRAMRLEDRVHLLDDVADRDLPVLLRHARLMVYPSCAEGFGMPVLEALASGVPVITSNTTSLPEVAGGAAWLVTPGNVPQLAETMRAALAEAPAARAERIASGLAHAATFSWQATAAVLLAEVRRMAPLPMATAPG